MKDGERRIRPAGADRATWTFGLHADTVQTEAPREVGNYRILRKIGEGGMGEVYEAEQQQPVRRRVALKLIEWGMDTRQVVARFEIERQALALMNHTNIARVLDAGATECGRPYFVMEYVEGLPISDYCDGRGLGIRQRLELFIQVCEGVQHAHQKGVIHRDIKPSNVLVTHQGEKPLPKIIDFGLAKAVEQSHLAGTRFTQLGQPIGTPLYMSPEQVGISGLDVDTRTDVYLLGMLLYELLAGMLPFDEDARSLHSFDELRRRIVEVEPPKPSSRLSGLGEQACLVATRRETDPASLVRRLRDDLDWIVMKALEKDRARRYASATEMAADLERHLRHEPVHAGPPSRSYRFRKFLERHRFGATLAAVVFLAMAVGTAGTSLGFVRALRAERVALAEAERASKEAARANQEAETARLVSEFLVGLFEVSQPGEAKGNSITAREILDSGANKIRQDLQDQPPVQARMMDTMGRVYRSLGLYDQARPLLESALAIRLRTFGEDHPDVAASLNSLALLLWSSGDDDGALPLFERALVSREKIYGPEDPEVAKTLNNLGILARNRGDLEEARRLYARALGILEDSLGSDHLDVAKTLNNLAILARNAGDLDEALRLYRRALGIMERTQGPEHPAVAKSLGNLGLLLAQKNDYEGARSSYERSLSIRETALGVDHPAVALTLHNLANLLVELGDQTRARELFERAQAIWEARLKPDHPYIIENLERHADLLIQVGEHRQGEALRARAGAIREKRAGS